MPGMSKLKKPDAPLCRALATLVVLLAVSVLVWLALVRPQLGKGRSETISDDYSASTILQDGQTAKPDLHLRPESAGRGGGVLSAGRPA